MVEPGKYPEGLSKEGILQAEIQDTLNQITSGSSKARRVAGSFMALSAADRSTAESAMKAAKEVERATKEELGV